MLADDPFEGVEVRAHGAVKSIGSHPRRSPYASDKKAMSSLPSVHPI